ncbi:hypothetical protein Q5Y75_16665 [Ruegeria sp. 2205SS24-7]|uniref:hypothetical protein n=1 Tax=Ruegeria discodermiae TaxID=3064389 RepID=UPI0027412807|nr:hypothetical protein [Ruegeria sp. 2205SS24-7]MDP5218860.1 hypothetical protein [Ruegeria sp. 2205SS24-7]
MYAAIVLYLFAAAVVGLLGRETAAGFIGIFLIAVVLSPIIALILLVLIRPNKRARLMIEQGKLDREEMRLNRRSAAKSK